MNEPHYADGPVTIWHGDCITVMGDMADNSIDSVVTDPPYGLEFMGKDWDGADGFRRSLNPADAGRDNAFGRMSAKAPEYKTRGRGNSGAQFAEGTVGGFEGKPMPRFGKRWTQRRCEICGHVDGGGSPCQCETPVWIVTSEPGTPRFASTFQAWCEIWASEAFRLLKPGGHLLAFGGTRTFHRLASAIEDAGFEIRDSIAWMYGSGFPKSRNLDGDWAGWGTALKPAFEPIVVARKPLAGTVAGNVNQYGTGALNIDGSRILARDPEEYAAKGASVVGLGSNGDSGTYGAYTAPRTDSTSQLGRWPANVVLDESQAAALDQQSGTLTSGALKPYTASAGDRVYAHGLDSTDRIKEYTAPTNSGGASRFFYTAKAGQDERPSVDGTSHPTVKPVDLMRWLVKLVTPPNGIVLEPFAGSGSTVEACIHEGFHCIAIEREANYLPLILKRVRKPHAVGFDFGDWDGA